MIDSTGSPTALAQYECESCLHRLRADHRPANCPACGCRMHAISVPRE